MTTHELPDNTRNMPVAIIEVAGSVASLIGVSKIIGAVFGNEGIIDGAKGFIATCAGGLAVAGAEAYHRYKQGF